MKKALEERDQLLANKDQAQDSSKHKGEEETPISAFTDSTSKFNMKPFSKNEHQEGRSRANTNMAVVKNLNLDVLRNKLMNTEIEKDRAIKMSESMRDKYIKMQDLISTMMDQKQIGSQLPPDPAKKDKFIKTGRRHALGTQVIKHGHSSSIHAENAEGVSPNAPSTRRRPKDTSEIMNSNNVSRDNSRRRRTTNLTSLVQSFQGKMNFPMELQTMEENVNLYAKELQKR